MFFENVADFHETENLRVCGNNDGNLKKNYKRTKALLDCVESRGGN